MASLLLLLHYMDTKETVLVVVKKEKKNYYPRYVNNEHSPASMLSACVARKHLMDEKDMVSFLVS